MKFLVDNQLPPVLARQIQDEFGEEAVHVADLGLQEASDSALWAYAAATNAILISKDEDFVNLMLRSYSAGLLWIRMGNCRTVFLLNVFRRAWPRIVERLRKGERFIEIR